MLSKIQKIWLWVSGALFLVPEILWSPVMNFYYEFYKSSYSGNVQPFRDSFLQNSDNLRYLKFIVLLQSIGLLLFTISLIVNRKNIVVMRIVYLFLMAPLLILLLLVLFVLFFIFAFNPNIG
jgi:hypothetical protein